MHLMINDRQVLEIFQKYHLPTWAFPILQTPLNVRWTLDVTVPPLTEQQVWSCLLCMGCMSYV